MYYYCKNSSKKIIHSIDCFHVQHTEIDNIGWFETLTEAYEQGYRLCNNCSPLVKHYKREDNEITEFCRKNGLAVHFGNKCISICSPRSQWKIALDKKNKIVLYHKNDFTTDKDHLSEISGYHLQDDARRNSIVDYLQYIVDHDYFRMLNPAYIPQKKKDSPPPRKGTKRYKSAQRRIEKYERKKAIKNVINLIESLSIPSQQMHAMAVC
ncbi:MAG: hypothetical protein IJF69_05150 [Clostridia bacterium]|nr:hypothetical protein [Clostridia bacterium]